MMRNYKVITLCGSTRFKDQFIETQKRLTLDACLSWLDNKSVARDKCVELLDENC